MATTAKPKPILDALPDTLDFRDAMYVPSLIEVPPVRDPDRYRKMKIPILDQGKEGACTGYALATVANFLLAERGKATVANPVSAWMLYTMAKRYDEWPGEQYSGSSARGAMKGWHKHGVCAEALWKDNQGDMDLTAERGADAVSRPLGAYFRVNHKDLVAMHAAISEVGMLYATARVHRGWQQVEAGQNEIKYSEKLIGGHAFVIVGYDREGFWIQNSWGPDWGDGGLARLSYPDWLENATDVWVAAMGAPVNLRHRASAAADMRSGAPRSYEGYIYSTLRPHIVTARNDGALDPKGEFGLTQEGLRRIIEQQMVERMAKWPVKRLVLYAHGGLVDQNSAIQTVVNNRQAALNAQVYPLSFIWRSDAWSTIRNMLRDAMSRRRDEGLLDSAKDFMLDRLDDMLEPIARLLGGKAMWDEMKENATRATTSEGGAARAVADLLAPLQANGGVDEIHLVGHSAGSIFHAPLARYLVEKGVRIDSLTLWAPACTIKLFNDFYRPLIEDGRIGAFHLYVLDDATEQDDHCANIYNKSLLYLVSHALEDRPRIPFDKKRPGEPLLGLHKHVTKHLGDFWADGRDCHVAPGSDRSNARAHGAFDNDGETLKATLNAIVGENKAAAPRQAPTNDHFSRRRVALEAALKR